MRRVRAGLWPLPRNHARAIEAADYSEVVRLFSNTGLYAPDEDLVFDALAWSVCSAPSCASNQPRRPYS